MTGLYDFMDYRDYLARWIEAQAGGGHGLRKRIADHLGCQGAFISQVIHKAAHLSIEHGFKLSRYLQHSAEETDYLILLMQYQRAGNEEMRDYFRRKIEAVHRSRLLLKNRVRGEAQLTAEDQAQYYGAWHYPAIRLLTTIPEFRSREKLLAKLRIAPQTFAVALEFLLRTGMVLEQDGMLLPGRRDLHLGNDSPFITKHHMNWRLQAMSALGEEKEDDLHYSVGVTLSREDVVRVKAKLVEFVTELNAVFRDSTEEKLCAFCLDWFEI